MNLRSMVLTLILLPFYSVAEVTPYAGIMLGGHMVLSDTYHQPAPKGVFGGFQFGLEFDENWHLEGGYQHFPDMHLNQTSEDVKAWLVNSALRYDLALQDQLDIYGRLGLAYWYIEKSTREVSFPGYFGVSPSFGVGVNYKINQNLRLNIGYQYIHNVGKSEVYRYDSYGLLLELNYKFNSKSPLNIEKEPNLETVAKALKTNRTFEEKIEPKSVIEELKVEEIKPIKFIFSSHSTGGAYAFDANSTAIGQAFREELKEVSDILLNHVNAKVNIVGHTDSVGSASYNQILSLRRAQTVADTLIDFGVKPSQINVSGAGESNPVASNTLESGRAQNRRVELTIPSLE